MAFIISKNSTRYGDKQQLYYLVENYRDGNKVKRRTLLLLKRHKNLTELLEATKQEELKQLNRQIKCEGHLEEFIKTGISTAYPFSYSELVKKYLTKWVERSKIKLKDIQDSKQKIMSYM